MKSILILTIFILTMGCHKYSIKHTIYDEYDFKGKVVKIYTYKRILSILDTININSHVSFEGEANQIYYFRQDGLIEKIISNLKSDTIENVISYSYDKRKNLNTKTIETKKGKEILKTIVYKYVIKGNELKEIDNAGRLTSLKKIDHKGRIIFEANYRTESEVVTKIKSIYNDDQLVFKIHSRNNKTTFKTFFTYDEFERKRIVQNINENGDYLDKKTYAYLNDNEIEITHFGINGEINRKMKKIIFEDENQNIFKEYIFDFTTNETIISEYKIEYK